MAYGSPAGEEQVEAYYTHVRGGRTPSPEALAELKSRYRAIGASPLTEITRAQAAAIGERLVRVDVAQGSFPALRIHDIAAE